MGLNWYILKNIVSLFKNIFVLELDPYQACIFIEV